MHYIADLHVHSHYSRATSKNLNLEALYQWATLKGIHVVGTGDFTHPQWFQELQEKLVPDGTGFFQLKNPPPPLCKSQPTAVRFCLTTEISSIYKHNDKVHKNHNLLFAPDLATVAKINAKLATIGNLTADGRPILGLTARDLLEIVLEASARAYLIPAHIWTPWFSTLGSKSGYDSIEACFRDLTDHIFALETGLSSDPAMNWRLSALDRYTMVSNSDAHSPQKLGREANLFDTAMTYDAMFLALKTKKGFLGTLEFFPEEGKYHLDGHRKCGICTEPVLTQQYQGMCPTCNKPLTIGVLHRVEALADRTQPQKPAQAAHFTPSIPLPEIIAEINQVTPNSKRVQPQFQHIIAQFGNEYNFLHIAPITAIQKHLGAIYAEAIRRLRQRQIIPIPGYDGLYGTIRIFQPGELEQLTGQLYFFAPTRPTTREHSQPTQPFVKALDTPKKEANIITLNAAQLAVKTRTQGVTLVKAGPGTGKTQTLIQWLQNCLAKTTTEKFLAITFTTKAADEMNARLTTLLGDQAARIQVATFHAIGYQLLKAAVPALQTVYDEEDRRLALQLLFPALNKAKQNKLSKALTHYFETGTPTAFAALEDIAAYAQSYQAYLQQRQAVDLGAIIQQLLQVWAQHPEKLAQQRYDYIAVDELQDISPSQYQFIHTLGQGKNMLAIGDPDQAIYGFRGADVKLFFCFKTDFHAQEICLTQNYRTTQTIVQAASALIHNNTCKSNLQLRTDNTQGAKISLWAAADESAEATYVVDQIKTYVGGVDNLALGTHDTGNYTFADIAVLFRQKAVGKALIAQLKKAGIPAHFSDGTTFLAPPPFCLIADLLRLCIQPHAITALHRFLIHGLQWKPAVINKLLATISPTTQAWPPPACLPPAAQHTYQTWLTFQASLVEIVQQQGLTAAIKAILQQYIPDHCLDESQQLQKEAILTLAKEKQADIKAFLDHMTLSVYTDAGRIQGEGIHLLTFHAAKGLEFPIVFIIGAEEGITPIQRSDSDIEEERRLFYVALTRAKEKVQLTYAQKRLQYGQEKTRQCTRFVHEIPHNLIDKLAPINKAKQKQVKQLKLF